MVYKTDTYILLGVEQSELNESLSSNLVQSLVGRTLLISCLKEIGIYKHPPIVNYGEHGKPYLSNYSGWYFNISHCTKAVVCILSTQEMGIDIELVDENNLELAEEVLNQKELSEVTYSHDPKRIFCRYWTKKESFLKCSGVGMSDDLKNILKDNASLFLQFSEKEYEICICWKKN